HVDFGVKHVLHLSGPLRSAMLISRPMPPIRSKPRRADTLRARRPIPAAARKHGWLVFAHQLPAHPSNARVKIWRRMQQIGAVALKNAVYVLPNNEQAREDFEWLRAEVIALG